MAIASNFLIAGNDEHGINPPTAGKRTPIMPYINRSFYENEFNERAKMRFLEACLRTGFYTFDVKPEQYDVSVSTRVSRINTVGADLAITFAYNAFGAGLNFNSATGFYSFYSIRNRYASLSRALAEEVFEHMLDNGFVRGRSVGTLTNVGILDSVACPSALLEAGFMTNFEEAKLMVNPDYTLVVGERCCRAVCDFLSVAYISRTDLSAYPLLVVGQRGNKVKLMQYLLNRYGARLAADGVFGSGTRSAVVTFQSNNDLVADGIVGSQTWRALLDLNPTAKTIRQGSRSSNVVYLQELLLSYLYPISSIDGVFGNNTRNNVLAFQREHALTADGVVGSNTWRALLNSTGRPLPQ